MVRQAQGWVDRFGYVHNDKRAAEAVDKRWSLMGDILDLLDDGGRQDIRMPSSRHLAEWICDNKKAVLEILEKHK